MTRLPELYACLHAPEFPLQAMLRLRPALRSKPCVVLDGEPPVQQVCSRNAAARSLGVEHGMTRVEIETFPAIAVLERSPAEESAAKAALLECAAAFSPRLEDRCATNAFLCLLDIAGTGKLWGSPAQLAKTVLQQVRSLGISAALAVSANAQAAVACVRGLSTPNRIQVIPPGEEAAQLSALPLSVLELSEAHAATFAQWGIRTLGMLAALPEKELIARLGQQGKRLRLEALGQLPHLFAPIETPVELIERMELETPVELLDSLLFLLSLMLDRLILRAAAHIFALASVTAVLSLDGGARHTRTVKPALPSNDKQLWLKLMHLDLEAHPPQAAILALTLIAEHGDASKVQLGLFAPQLPESARLDVTLARIEAIVGPGRAGRARLKDTHRNAGFDAFQIEPFQIQPSRPSAQPTYEKQYASARTLRPAENVAVALRGHKPEAFVFRGQRYIVERAYGPWQSSGNWWNPTLWSDEQWDVFARSSEGAMLGCCLVEDLVQNLWKLAALYD